MGEKEIKIFTIKMYKRTFYFDIFVKFRAKTILEKISLHHGIIEIQ